MPLNKKAQTAIGLIPIIALALSALALFSFLSFKNDFQSQSALLTEMMTDIEFNYQYILSQSSLMIIKSQEACPSCSNTQLIDAFKSISLETEEQYHHEGVGNFYGKIRNDEFEIIDNKLIINEIVLESHKGRNRVKRAFNIELEFE